MSIEGRIQPHDKEKGALDVLKLAHPRTREVAYDKPGNWSEIAGGASVAVMRGWLIPLEPRVVDHTRGGVAITRHFFRVTLMGESVLLNELDKRKRGRPIWETIYATEGEPAGPVMPKNKRTRERNRQRREACTEGCGLSQDPPKRGRGLGSLRSSRAGSSSGDWANDITLETMARIRRISEATNAIT